MLASTFALCRFAFCDLSLVKKIMSFALLVVSLGWRKIFVLGVHLFDLVLLLSIVKKAVFCLHFSSWSRIHSGWISCSFQLQIGLCDSNCPCTPTRIFPCRLISGLLIVGWSCRQRIGASSFILPLCEGELLFTAPCPD